MCDFLVSLGKRYNGKELLDLIKRPYRERAPSGQFFDFSWGSAAILHDRIAHNKNIITKNSTIFAWVGDLVTDLQGDFQKLFVQRLTQLRRCADEDGVLLKTDSLFEKLNGAFAILVADDAGFIIITDPISFVPAYTGTNSNDETVAFGTHTDMVASISQNSHNIDLVSVAHFLNAGNCTFPYTMYKNVKEIRPGTAHIVQISGSKKTNERDCVYWTPPAELREGYDENELAKELRNALLSSVKDRCTGRKIGVLLSGGLDSRVVMAAVPKSADCIGLTFCNAPNRETCIASRVARCYNRKWHLLVRDVEFLANNTVDIVRFTGCELDWVSAHNMGFVETFDEYHVDAFLSGMPFDDYLKGYKAHDMVKIKKLCGIMQPRFKRKVFDYANNMADFWKQKLSRRVVSDVYDRRKFYYEDNIESNRSSIEWHYIYPYSQSFEAAYWVADRRVIPLRLPGTDRRILDFAFKCPTELKLGDRILQKAARDLLGKGCCITNANDGVRPCSGHWLRLAQRAIRKLLNGTTAILEKLGKESKTQHSWHDYQKYWSESTKLRELIHEYGVNLDQFDGILFKENGRFLLERKDINWQYGFRLIQLAVWLGIIKEYRESEVSAPK